MLHKDTLTYKEVDFDKNVNVEKRNVIIRDTLGYDLSIDENTDIFPLKFFIYEYLNFDSRLEAMEENLKIIPNFLELYGITYNLDSLYWGKLYKQYQNQARKVVPITAYKFELSKESYVLIYANYFSGVSTTNNYKALLFNIDSGNMPHYIEVPDEQASPSIWSFGDFNKNGKLDYAQWNANQGHEKNRLVVYELNTDNFQILSDFYIILKIDNAYEGPEPPFIVDKTKSKWFFELF
jgi:hypothetical protein